MVAANKSEFVTFLFDIFSLNNLLDWNLVRKGNIINLKLRLVSNTVNLVILDVLLSKSNYVYLVKCADLTRHFFCVDNYHHYLST